MKALFKLSYYIFFLALLGVGTLLVASLFAVPGSIQVKIVKSGSMEPTIRTGGVVILKPVETYSVDDVITFGEDTKTVIPTTHRIIEVEEVDGALLYTTKGDANEDPDNQKVREEEIIGKVLFSIPYAGFVLDFARQPLGFALLIGIPALAIIVDELSTIWGVVRKRREDKKEKKKKKQIEEKIDTAHKLRDEQIERRKMRMGVTNRFLRAKGPEKPKVPLDLRHEEQKGTDNNM